ncbi:MAG: nicotinate-nucleotide adenylyltransferase [Bacteroidota bacterium]
MNLGVFGGTFNPPHHGHLLAAEFVRERLSLDRVFFVPTAAPPHKRDLALPEARHRMEMLRLAVRENPFFSVSEVELARGGVSYTVDTLRQFRGLHPSADLLFLLGSDGYAEFHTWREPEGILELARVVVMARPGYALPPGASRDRRVELVEVPQIAIESRLIRRRVREGRSIRYMLPPAVETYIRRNGLYRGEGTA